MGFGSGVALLQCGSTQNYDGPATMMSAQTAEKTTFLGKPIWQHNRPPAKSGSQWLEN